VKILDLAGHELTPSFSAPSVPPADPPENRPPRKLEIEW